MAKKSQAKKSQPKSKPAPAARSSVSGKRSPQALSLQQQLTLDLQRQIGNLQTRRLLQKQPEAKRVQRREVELPEASETLFNEENERGELISNTYSISGTTVNYGSTPIRFEMTRSANQVNVHLRLKFVQSYGTDTAAAVPLPEGQPRETASEICTQLLGFWNTTNRFELVGSRTPAAEGESEAEAPEPEEVRLPLRFSITPVFDLGAAAHNTVRLDTVNAGGSTDERVVDAANWYSTLDPAVYSGGIGDTYAHEFGHLLGIPDEYSLSNPDAHQLMHRISPNPETRANLIRTIDDAGVRELILQSLQPAIQTELARQSRNLSAVLMTQKEQIVTLLAEHLRATWADESVLESALDMVRTELADAGRDPAVFGLERIMRFQAGENLSNLGIVRRLVPEELNPAHIRAILASATGEAVRNASAGTLTLPYQEEGGGDASVDVTIEAASSVGEGTSPLAESAEATAAEAVGAPTSGRRAAAIYPSETLMARLMALPSGWTDLASEMETDLSLMPAQLRMAFASALETNTSLAGVGAGLSSRLYRAIYNLVQSASNATVRATLRDFLYSRVYPLIDEKVTEIMAEVDSEIARHHTASGTGTTADPDAPPDPAVMASVQQMQETARTMLAPTPGAAPDQPSTAYLSYTANTLMGANSEGTSLRPEQLGDIVAQFNDNVPDLRHEGEERFTARRQGA